MTPLQHLEQMLTTLTDADRDAVEWAIKTIDQLTGVLPIPDPDVQRVYRQVGWEKSQEERHED